ncbi:MAG: CHASE domain-containing protein [Betaproteobacteria bacterium]|nr:CHASE domain-containing protein [Betaproteobacteria bacterium]
MNNWQRLIDRRNRPAWVVFLIFLSLTLIAWDGQHRLAVRSAAQEFELHVRDVIGSIEERLRQHEQILLGAEGLLVASESVTRAEWRTYVERLHLKENYSGIQGVGFVQIIRPADLQAHIAALRAEGFPDYTVHPPGDRSLYTSTIYLEPFSGRNLAAFGYDMMSEATRAKAMRMAAESGKTTISGKVKLVQETHGKEQAGFLMYLPVYREHRALTTPEEGWQALQGFVYSPYRVDDLMAGILGKRILMLDFVIFDGEGETDGARMFVSADERADGTHAATPKMSTMRSIQAYGHTWTVRLQSRPEFDASFQSPLDAVIPALGGGISVLLFVLVSFLISRRERAEEMAAQMTMDIRANEEKLRQSEMRIHAIVDGADHLIISTNTEGVIELFNRAAERYLGYRAEEVIGKSALSLFLDPDEVFRRSQEMATEGMSVEPGIEVFTARARKDAAGDTHEWTYIRKDGSRFPVSLTVTALRDGNGEISAFLGIATDITERKKIERMKTEFISTVSHELRTPLTSIRGALALVAGGVVGELPAAVKPLVEIAHKNSERLILLVNDLLDMEKIEAGKMEFNASPLKLMPLLNQALDGNRAYAEQYQVNYAVESDLPEAMVSVDANRMMQVLANLLSNAAKYSPAGGKVLVAVERMGKRIRVAVKDNGPGIPDEFKARVFQKFAQADSSDTRNKGGTGLGLSITKAIVEHMGGRIWFDSQPNLQTTFYVEFPEWVERKLPEIGHGIEGATHRVLVCEDNRDTATVLRMMLEQAGYAVDIAYDANQAKQLLAQGGYATMTLDLALPGQSGISLIRELHGHEATAMLPILVVSARAAEGKQELNGEEFGIIEWIDKPVNQDRLLAVINGVVGRSGQARAKVLHVEDDADIFHVMHEVAGEVADTVHAANLAEARQMLAQCRYDLVILDLDLPDGSGKELLPLLKGASPPIPVMVFSVYEIGLEDAKEVDAALVKSRTDNAELLATIKRLIGVE